MLLHAVNNNNTEEYTSFQNPWHLQSKVCGPIAGVSVHFGRVAKRENESSHLGREGKAWGNSPNWREMNSMKNTENTVHNLLATVCQREANPGNSL